MGFLSFLFGGKYPSTQKYEASLEKEAADYERFKQIASSADYARFKELEATVNSNEFKNRVHKLKTERFSDTEAYKQEQEYNRLAKSSDLKMYTKFKSKQLDKRLDMAKQSNEYTRYKELESNINSPEFLALQKQKDFKKTAEYQTLKEYQKLYKSSAVKFIRKTEASEAYNNFLKVDGSDRLKKMQALEEAVNSSEFKKFKAEMEDSKRFKKSAEAQTINEYETLAKNKDIVWYQKNLAANTFNAIANRTLTFNDEFTNFDKQKWGVGYYYGIALANTSYSLMNERQTFSAKNVRSVGSELFIETRREDAKGKRWNPTIGFIDGEFDYTSSLINTGSSFRQKYGRFDFKVKMSQSAPVTHNIWMVGEKQTPMINVVTFGNDKKNIRVGSVSNNGAKTVTVDGANFSEYQIISLIWTANSLTWFINGKEVYTQKSDIPQEPMYINISSNVVAEGDTPNAQLAIDWVRVYEMSK